ncbi:MAG: hypothetical protein ACK5GN_05985 [Pseudomonadota bacterium]|jgi:hypothetical protein
MSDTANSHGSSPQVDKKNVLEPFGLAAGLLWNDRYWIIPLCFVLVLSTALDLLLQHLGYESWAAVVIFDRALQIGVVAAIVLRWRKLLQGSHIASLSLARLTGRIAVVSVASSVLLAMPLLGLTVNAGGGSSLLFMVLGALGIVWCLRVYFYFAVVGILGSAIVPGLAQAVRISKSDGTAALRSLLVPCGLTLLLTALLTMPSPDGRSVFWMTAASSAECVFWILSTYCALGYALTAFSESEWRAAGLTPYRHERLSTIQKQGGLNLPKYLRPKSGAWMCLAAVCCMAANLGRQLNEPPAASVAIKKVTVADYTIKVELEVEDRSFRFRGFHPVAFSIKTKTGFAVSNSLTSVAHTSDGAGISGAIVSPDGAPRPLFLTFSTGKTAAALRGLDNIWLWYQLQPLVAITPQMLASSDPAF